MGLIWVKSYMGNYLYILILKIYRYTQKILMEDKYE